MRAHHILLALTCLTSPSFADPPPCFRWEATNLSDCEALDTLDCKPTPIQKEVINGQRYSSTALEGCKKLIKHKARWQTLNGWAPLYNYKEGEEIRACYFEPGISDKNCYDIEEYLAYFPPSQTTASCVYDADDDDDIDSDDNAYYAFTVSHVQRAPEAHCYCTVTGPYSSIDAASLQYTPLELALAYLRHIFPGTLKREIINENRVRNLGRLKSDARTANGVYFDPNRNLQKHTPLANDAAEIDHIIPRVDSQGCLCGDVTPNNAAVISRELNGKMSNISPKNSLERSKMYQRYTTGCDPTVWKYEGPKNAQPLPLSLETLQTDESAFCVPTEADPPVPSPTAPPVPLIARPDQEPGSGGCATVGGAASGPGILVALLALVLRLRLRLRRRQRRG